MPSRSISLCFACTSVVLALALHVYLARARPLRFGVFQSPEHMADLAFPCAPGPDIASGEPSPRARVLPYPYL
eukprot:6213153-Pleurochrysis_carterae.AAC.1